MIVANTINISSGIGKTVTNAYLLMIPYVGTIQSDGKVPCDLKFYYSQADQIAKANPIYPIIGNDLTQLITNSILQFSPGEIVKVNGNCTMDDVFAYFKTKLAAKLLADYGWTVTI